MSDRDETHETGEGKPGDGAQAGAQTLPVDWSTEPAPAYANGGHVVHTARDFAVLFTEHASFPGRLSGAEGQELARIVASLRMTPDVFFQMLCMLTSNWNKFANEMIDPRMRRPRFKLLDAGEVQLDGLPKKASED